MHNRFHILSRLALPLLLAILLLALPSFAQGWEGGFPVRITYQELDGMDYGNATVTLTMTVPAGTPLIARETALGSALSALRDLWNIESVHEEVRGFLGPVVPMDIQRSVASINGSGFILTLMDSFDTVSDAGFSRFQIDTLVTFSESLSIPRQTVSLAYPDAPRFSAWVIGGGWPESDSGHENWVMAALINYSASVLSFRSEYGRFPSSFVELREMNHLLIEPLNPYTGQPVIEVNDVSPGDITYQYIDNSRVILLSYIELGGQVDVIRREISVSASGAYDLLYRQTAGFAETDKRVARYVFQIAQILNEYYYQNGDLPYGVPQCEAGGFAYVSFLNPYTSTDAQQADSLANIQPGDYTYHRVSPSSYFLGGYGGSGQIILAMSEDFGTSEISTGALRAQ